MFLSLSLWESARLMLFILRVSDYSETIFTSTICRRVELVNKDVFAKKIWRL